MRRELLKKRNELNRLIKNINYCDKPNSKVDSFELVRLKKENIKKYQFINNLLKVI